MVRRRDVLGLALLCFTAFIAPAQGREVRIAAIAPLSGPAAFDGHLGVTGMRAMVNVINERGGVLGGRKLALMTYDDKGLPEEGISAVRRAVDQDDVDLIVGGWFSAVALAERDATKGRILALMTSAQHPDVTLRGHPWLFRLNATSTMMSSAYSQYICTQLQPRSVAFMTVNDDFGRLELQNYERLLADCGVSILGNSFFNRTDVDFAVALTRLRGLEPDAIYVTAGNTSQAAMIYRQIRHLLFRGSVLASAGNLNPKMIELAGASIEGVYSATLLAPDGANERFGMWRDELGRLSFDEPSLIAALGAQAIEILAEVIDAAGSTRDYEKMAALMRAREWPTLMGEIRFDAHGQAAQRIHIVRVHDGALRRVGADVKAGW